MTDAVTVFDIRLVFDMIFGQHGVESMKVAINGLGRIGRCTLKLLLEQHAGSQHAGAKNSEHENGVQVVALVDGPAKKFRRGRAAATSLIPTSTGAAEATGDCLPQFAGKFTGGAIRGPVACGSIADIVSLTARDTTAEEINDLFRQEAASPRYQGILGVAEAPLVSADIIQDPRSSIVDLNETKVTAGNLVKVMSWYDNEWGYSAQMIRYAHAAIGARIGAA